MAAATPSEVAFRYFGPLRGEANYAARASVQETQQIQSPNLPFHHRRRRQEDRSVSQEEDDLCSGRSLRCGFLCSARKSKTYRGVEDREGSHNRHSERGRFLRGGLPYRADCPVVFRNRDDRLLGDENREEVHGGRAAPRTCVFRVVRGLFTDPEHPLRRGFGGPTLQLQRETAGSCSPPAGSLWQGRKAGSCNSKNQSRDPG